MRRALLGISIATACGGSPAPAPAPVENTAPPAAETGLPAEVKTLLERWETCWHFAGEEPYDAERRKEIEQGLAKWCPGNEAERERLRKKWEGRADVQEALRKLDEMQ